MGLWDWACCHTGYHLRRLPWSLQPGMQDGVALYQVMRQTALWANEEPALSPENYLFAQRSLCTFPLWVSPFFHTSPVPGHLLPTHRTPPCVLSCSETHHCFKDQLWSAPPQGLLHTPAHRWDPHASGLNAPLSQPEQRSPHETVGSSLRSFPHSSGEN